jgi:hypothetical protein
MTDLLTLLLRVAGGGLVLLALLHIPIGKKLRWKEDCKRLTPVNESVFHVHTFFICLVLVMMALPCLIEPSVFLIPSRAGAWLAWSFAGFWVVRLYFQWFVYKADLWRGGPLVVHPDLGGTGQPVCGLWSDAGRVASVKRFPRRAVPAEREEGEIQCHHARSRDEEVRSAGNLQRIHRHDHQRLHRGAAPWETMRESP